MSPRRDTTADREDSVAAAPAGWAAASAVPAAPAVPAARPVDPRAIRVSLGPTAAHAELAPIVVAGQAAEVRLERFGPVRVVLVDGRDEPTRTAVILMPVDDSGRGGSPDTVSREVIVGGWRVEVEIGSEHRATLRERASGGRAATAHSGSTEVRAIIPGRVLSVSVAPGDSVVAYQQILVVEAMKMQNELRAPRDGVISRIAVGPGVTIEVGDLLLVLE